MDTGATFTLLLEKDRFAVGEPILGLLVLTNPTADTLRDIPYMTMDGNRLAPSLRNIDSGTRHSKTGLHIDVAYLEPGLSLGPGASYSEVLNFAEHFGDNPGPEHPLHDAQIWFILQEGRYELMLSFVPETRARGGGRFRQSVRCTTPFEITNVPDDSLSAAIRRDVKSVSWMRARVSPENREVARRLLEAGAAGPWFWSLHPIASLALSEHDMDGLFVRLRDPEVPPLRSALLLALRYGRPLHDLHRYEALLDKREAEARTEMERLVIATLRMKADQRRYFSWARDDEYR